MSNPSTPEVALKHVRLGGTGLHVSELCLGTMTFGDSGANSWGLPTMGSDEEAHAMLDRFVAAGGNFIDTADVYGPRTSEEVIGRWLARIGPEAREDLVIATKCRSRMGKGANSVGLSRKHILAACDASLRRLQTPYVDLYQVHYEDPSTPLEETLRALHHLVETGRARYVGVSNFRAFRIAQAAEICRRNGWNRFVCLQAQYHLLCRETEYDLLPVCVDEGMGVIPWSPLAGGLLTGRYKRGEAAPAGSRGAWADKAGWKWTSREHFDKDDGAWATIDEVVAVAAEVGRTPAQVALRWLMQQPAVTAPIIGASKMSHLEDNLAAATFSLSDEHMARLTKASDAPRPYPWLVRESRG